MIYAGRGMRAGAIDYALLDGLVVARFFRREVAIGFAFFNQLPRGDPMLLSIVGLKNYLFIVIKSEPFQSVDDRAKRTRTIRTRGQRSEIRGQQNETPLASVLTSDF